jgi:hypothetical protein
VKQVQYDEPRDNAGNVYFETFLLWAAPNQSNFETFLPWAAPNQSNFETFLPWAAPIKVTLKPSCYGQQQIKVISKFKSEV